MDDARVVDQQRDRSQLALGLCDELLDCRLVGHIRCNGEHVATALPNSSRRGIEVRCGPSSDRDCSAGSGERVGNRTANAASPTGDYCDLAVEPAHVDTSAGPRPSSAPLYIEAWKSSRRSR